MSLEGDSANRGGYDERRAEACVVRACHVAEEADGPRAGVAPVQRQSVVGVNRVVVGQVDKQLEPVHVGEFAVIRDAFQTVGNRHPVLVHEDLVRASHRWQEGEVSLAVEEIDRHNGCRGRQVVDRL